MKIMSEMDRLQKKQKPRQPNQNTAGAAIISKGVVTEKPSLGHKTRRCWRDAALPYIAALYAG
jgi:hypothetical protein